MLFKLFSDIDKLQLVFTNNGSLLPTPNFIDNILSLIDNSFSYDNILCGCTPESFDWYSIMLPVFPLSISLFTFCYKKEADNTQF